MQSTSRVRMTPKCRARKGRARRQRIFVFAYESKSRSQLPTNVAWGSLDCLTGPEPYAPSSEFGGAAPLRSNAPPKYIQTKPEPTRKSYSAVALLSLQTRYLTHTLKPCRDSLRCFQ